MYVHWTAAPALIAEAPHVPPARWYHGGVVLVALGDIPAVKISCHQA
jgi:hypothetical protein